MRLRSLPGHEVRPLRPPAAATRGALAALRRFVRARGARAEGEALADAARPLAVAFSGGADSTALLLAALRLWPGRAVHALHVHHGLQPAADDFAAHALARCADWGLDCRVLHVRVRQGRGDSVEEQARLARHAALHRAARELGCAWLLLGHHADDQAESLLLALLRGAGPAGLAAMPAAANRAGLWLGRPLLECQAPQLRAQLDAAGVPYVLDPMNEDPALRRGRIRRELLPVLERLEPAWRRTLGRSASLCAQAAGQLSAQARQDLCACRGEAGLRLADLAAWEPPRRAQVLRAWLAEFGLRSNAEQLDNLLRQLDAPAQAPVLVGIGRARLWRDGEWLRCEAGGA
ncbi:MAG: tRNA lysidine(34) synthetase TilS [Betaproteobacteria bacterium]|nr:tRNA lysidine(34) synthetase TilS [Betaproteobacteria bacterium]MDE2151566.1 tRNA lysidine(34) synthetase TilS [Betaproteobacteria bacterium]MDE2477952.1 tRNA lysidine(34) synthetase TilS [Betaproteobacteria bacterium]